MTQRDNVLWLQCWRDQRTDFTQAVTNPLLVRFWPGLNLAPGSRVFVPLCGRSLDMLWLAGLGHEVIGVELSPIAVSAFFKARKLNASRRKIGPFTLWQHGRLQVLCGDYFALTPTLLGRIDAVYDHTALTALPEDLRPAYVAQLSRIVPNHAPIFLLTTEDAAPLADLSAALVIDDEITRLYAENFAISVAYMENLPAATAETGVYKVYRLIAKSRVGVTLGVA